MKWSQPRCQRRLAEAAFVASFARGGERRRKRGKLKLMFAMG